MTPIRRFALCGVVSVFACRGGRNPARADDSLAIPVRDESGLRTDSLSYQLVRRPGEYRTFVRATYRNTTGTPVYFVRCGLRDSLPKYAIARTGADSTRAFFVDRGWGCVGGVPNGILAPGESISVRVPFGTIDQPSMQPPLRAGDLVGLFRIYVWFCSKQSAHSDDCEPFPIAERRSNAFVVHY